MLKSKLWPWIRLNGLLIGTLLGVLAGVLLGFVLRPTNLSIAVQQVIAFPGEIFTRSLQLMILPLVISSLVAGSASLNAKINGKIAVRTLSYFVITSFISAVLGVILVVIIHPGNAGIKESLGDSAAGNGEAVEERKNTLLDNFLDLGRNIVPSNIFAALFQQTQTVVTEIIIEVEGENHTTVKREVVVKDGTNTLGVIFFAMIFGTVLGTFGERAKSVIEGVKVIDDVIMVIVRGVMWITPLGVCSIIASKIISVEDIVTITEQLGLFVATVLAGVLIFQLIFYQVVYFIIKRKNPYRFYVGIVQATVTAFATASAAVALPITFRCLDRLKIDSRISHFTLPIGATVNMDGTACFVAIASIFIAQMNGIALNMGDYATVAISATAVSVASASVPSAALALMFIVLNAINVPTQDIGLLFVVDWLVDRIRTTNNLVGDCYATVFVEHFSRKELDEMDLQASRMEAEGEESNEIVTIATDEEHHRFISDPPASGTGTAEHLNIPNNRDLTLSTIKSPIPLSVDNSSKL